MLVASDKKILIVDDNLMNRKIFMGLLKHSEMKIYEADSGKACIELLKENKFDIIFLDHMMPEMDGIETLHIIKTMKDNLNKDTPIIALTANAMDDARKYYTGEGFSDYLAKPIEPHKLDELICKILPEIKMIRKY
ncbi:MAG: response regulator [Lachnospiraceae bacterium]|nr:response regulator [Lachnospiraceae bacterium]